MQTSDLRPQWINFWRRPVGLFAVFWFAVVILGPLPGFATKANAQANAQGSVLFDSCFVKGARVAAGINYKVMVDVSVEHPAFANPATTANLKVTDSATPPVRWTRLG